MIKPVYISAMAPSEMAILREKIEALPKKKRQKWHDTAKNENGTMCRIRYFNGDFQIKVLANNTKGKCMIPASGWTSVVASGASATKKQIVDAYGDEVVKAMEETLGARIVGLY